MIAITLPRLAISEQLFEGMEGTNPYVLPLVFSLFAGLSTGLGGVLVLCFRSHIVDLGVIACMLGIAASAMITVSMMDLFFEIAEQIGFAQTIACCVAGIATVAVIRRFGPSVLHEPKADESADSRLQRVGLITALTLTAHNLPEGMAVALSTLGSSALGLKMALAIALHNIPEGLAIAGPLLMSRKATPMTAIGITLLSGLSEPVGALLTLVFFRNVLTQELIDYALAFVGGVMIAVAILELVPEAVRTGKHLHTCAGFVIGSTVMAASLQILGD
mmetsp:Transcript_60083/g.147722  ORF Transcript_60083/g.147722 Transcript_60083/m.147722 type:complete len:276 (+) Transcript_60083:351-1178(+)